MRISELARVTRISVPTIKYYLREGLLPQGHPISTTQAAYDDSHVSRLRMIRAMIDVGALSVATVRSVLAAIDSGPDQLWSAIDQTHDALAATPDPPDHPPHRALAALTVLGWQAQENSAVVRQLDTALTAADQVGLSTTAQRLLTYADAAIAIAEYDVANIPTGHDPHAAAAAVTYVVLGTVLYEPLLLALRRLAQEQVYKRTHHDTSGSEPINGGRPRRVDTDNPGTPVPATPPVSDPEGEHQS